MAASLTTAAAVETALSAGAGVGGKSSSKTSSSSSSSILCFEHCGHKIFASGRLPDACPACHTPLTACKFHLPPFRLPAPFSRAHDFPCSVVIRPTRGDFLHDYRSGHNLHIAVTDSRGRVVEYDQRGLGRADGRTGGWGQCVAVNLLADVADASAEDDDDVADLRQDPDWAEYWDWTLAAAAKKSASSANSAASATPLWSKERYDEHKHNCFTFVLSFLRDLRQRPFSARAQNKVDFCQHYVLPKTAVAAKYIGLYRKLAASGGVCVIRRREVAEAEAVVVAASAASATSASASEEDLAERRSVKSV